MIKTVAPLSTTEVSSSLESFIQCRNNIVQNINSREWNDIAITGIEDLNIGNSFEIADNGIKCLFDGYIDIYSSIRGQSSVQRASPEIRITKNDVALEPISSSGYIRALSDHNTSSSSLRILSNCLKGDIIKVQSHKGAKDGVVNMIIGTSLILIKRINS